MSLAYYSSADCNSGIAGTFTTSNSSAPFPIATNTPFSLNSTSTYNVAVNLGIANPESGVQSVLVTFSNRDPASAKANFTGACTSGTNCCVPVACSAALGTCINNTGMDDQPFTFNYVNPLTFNTPGGTFDAPPGVTSVTVQAYGGGGSGGGRTSIGASGGGGGAYARGPATVVPNSSYTVSVGAGGSLGTNGGPSYFNTITTVYAAGGTGIANNTTSGGTGGLAASSIGATKFSGGGGSAVFAAGGGGGGSSAGIAADGAPGNTNFGGIAPPDGGNGGNGRTGGGNGSGLPGSTPGGGGGGARRTTTGTSPGASGGNGRVIIAWINPFASVAVQKITSGGAGGPFTFTQTNLASIPPHITTINPGTPTPKSPTPIIARSLGQDITITETPAAGFTTLSSASCTDVNYQLSGNPPGAIGVFVRNVLTIPADNVVAGAQFNCVFDQ